jgi:PAS domain S-box-containing protein
MQLPDANPSPAPGQSEPESDGSTAYYPAAKAPRWLVPVFLLSVLALAGGLGYFVLNQFRAGQHAVEDGLRSVTELKIAQLVAWRQERFGDAVVVANLPGLADMLLQLSAAPGSVPARMGGIDNYLNAARRAYAYREIHLLDRSLRPVRSYPVGREWDGVISPQNREELLRFTFSAHRSEPPVIEDLHLEKTGLASMHVMVRVWSAAGELAGVAVLSIAAESKLFGLVESWPVENATAETSLIRREGDSFVFLSPLRFQPDAALLMRRPLTDPELLAAKALRTGQPGLVEGNDYRGVPVVGVALPVPGMPWIMTSTMERDEAYADAWKGLWQLSTALIFLLFVVVLFGRAWLHHRQSDLIARKLESERRRRTAAERLTIVMRNVNDVILLFDESMRVVEANDRAVATYGYAVQELRQLTAHDLLVPEAAAAVPRHYGAELSEAGLTFETIHRRKAGATFPVEVSSRPVMVDGRRHVQSIIRDISERKAHENEIERLNRLYLTISEVNKALVRAQSPAELFDEITGLLVKSGGFRIAWAGWLNPQTRFIEPIAVAGDTTGYTQDIRIASDPESSEGRGPSGTAFRENRIDVCNDFFSAPDTGPWRESAARAGFNATLALPLQQEGVTLGLLSVYAVEKDYFQPREIELLRETAGDICFALGVFARERRRLTAEAALQASESRLQFLISATPSIIYSMGARGDFATTFISDNIRNVLGYEPAAVMADPNFWSSHLHPDDAALAVALSGDLENKSTITREYRFRHGDGSWRWMHDEMRVTRDEQGRATELVGYWLDITARKTAQVRLKAREEVFSSIVGQAADAIALVEVATGRFLEFNRAAHEGLGYSREEFAAFRIGDIQAEHSAGEIRDNIGRILEHGGAIFESRHRCHDGSLRDVRVSARLLHLQGRECIAAVWSDITASKQAEAELRKLSLAVEQSPATVVITDLTGAIEYVNPRFTELTGYTSAEVIGKNPRILKSARTAPQVYADLWRTISSGNVWRGEIINRRKDGTDFTELAIVTPVKDAHGRATHYVALKEDITERKRSEESLRQSEQRFRELFDLESDAILVFEVASGRITMANLAAGQNYGYPVERLLTLRTDEISAEPEAPGENHRELSGTEGRVEKVPLRWHRRADGTIFPVEITQRIFRRDGKLLAVATLRDITLQQQARAQLERFNIELEQKVVQRTAELAVRNSEIQALLESIPDLVMRLHRDGTMVNFQPAKGATPLAAFLPTPGAAPGADLPEALLKTALAAGTSAIAAGATVIVEAEVPLGTGPLIAELRTAPIGRDEYVVFVRDITARKRLESESAAILEQERQMSEMKTRFISVTSHEFRTPMTAAMGSVELLTNHFDRLAPLKRQALLGRITTSLRRMTEMLDEVLLLNRMDADRVVVNLAPANLREQLLSFIEEIRLGDREAHVIDFRASGEVDDFATDLNLFHHIASNLLSNAVRYSPAGSTVTVCLAGAPEQLTLSVQDQGIGIPEKDRPRIFGAFERGSNVGNIKGTGLGLNIVKRMTKMLGGTVAVAPVEPTGSRFTLILPRPPQPPARA